MKSNEPFGLPSGTVRAILAIAIVLTICFLAIMSEVNITADMLKDFGLIALTFYFATKKAKEESKQ